MFKRIKRIVLKLLKPFSARKKTQSSNELEKSYKRADELACALRGASVGEKCEAVEIAAYKKQAEIICANIRRMMKTDDLYEFCTLYHDSLFLSENMYLQKGAHQKLSERAGEILKELKLLGKATACPTGGKAVCIKVTFGGGKKEYCYLAPENTYARGEYVCVPTGSEMSLKVACVSGEGKAAEGRRLFGKICLKAVECSAAEYALKKFR